MTTRIAMSVGGTVHTVDIDALTGRQELRLFNEIGMTIAEIMNATSTGKIAPFLVAGFVLLARTQAGENVTYDQISAGITYSTDCHFVDPEGPPPEPQGAGPGASSPN